MKPYRWAEGPDAPWQRLAGLAPPVPSIGRAPVAASSSIRARALSTGAFFLCCNEIHADALTRAQFTVMECQFGETSG